MNTLTTAQKISNIFKNDGALFEMPTLGALGIPTLQSLEELGLGPSAITNLPDEPSLQDIIDTQDWVGMRDGENWRYEFPDGSCLVGNDAGWDEGFGGCDCFCPLGCGHQADCDAC